MTSNRTNSIVPLRERGIVVSRAGAGFSKDAVRAAIAADLEATLVESGVTDFG